MDQFKVLWLSEHNRLVMPATISKLNSVSGTGPIGQFGEKKHSHTQSKRQAGIKFLFSSSEGEGEQTHKFLFSWSLCDEQPREECGAPKLTSLGLMGASSVFSEKVPLSEEKWLEISLSLFHERGWAGTVVWEDNPEFLWLDPLQKAKIEWCSNPHPCRSQAPTCWLLDVTVEPQGQALPLAYIGYATCEHLAWTLDHLPPGNSLLHSGGIFSFPSIFFRKHFPAFKNNH